MSLVEEILACPTPEQVLINMSELSDQELGEALDEVELVSPVIDALGLNGFEIMCSV